MPKSTIYENEDFLEELNEGRGFFGFFVTVVTLLFTTVIVVVLV